MFDLTSAYNNSKEDLDAMNEWCENFYSEHFGEYFEEIHNVHSRLESTKNPITDDELEWILVTLPLKLLDASERLSALRADLEVLKLKYKKEEIELTEQSQETTQTKKKQEAELLLMDSKLLNVAFSTIITRVETQISLSKELIMGAKKIFDSRRATEHTLPVSESSVMYTSEDYQRNKKSNY